MYPTLFEMQGLGFHTWGLFVMTAFVVSCALLSFRVGKVGIDSDKLIPFYMVITLGGLFGSRLLHFLMAEPAEFFAHPGEFFDFTKGGFAFYGGAIASTLGGVAVGKAMGMNPWKLADTGAPLVMLGLAIGRLGCFFAGCCHGAACGLPIHSSLLSMPGGSIVTVDGFPFLALDFKPGVGVGSIFNQALYPTQLWESTGAFLLFLGLSHVWRSRRRFDGQVIGLLLVTYPILRSSIEHFRGDTVRGTDWLGLFSTSQLVSIPIFVVGLTILLWRSFKGFEPETEFVPADDEDLEPA